jgi:hypothetical protein
MVSRCTDWEVLSNDRLDEISKWIETNDVNNSLFLTRHGVFCRECGVVYKSKGFQGNYAKYITEPAIPTIEFDIKRHLDPKLCERHRNAYDSINKLVYSDDSNFGEKFSKNARAARAKKNDTNLLEKALHDKVNVIHFMVREMIANFKYKSLQALIDKVGNNPELQHLKHTSNFSFLQFLDGIDHSLKDAFLKELEKVDEYSILLDECTDAEGISQIAFWIVYLDDRFLFFGSDFFFFKECSSN